SRTDRIVFKLFGKDPNHFPNGGLRPQILNWLSHSPTDIESYIRPGCIILTVYLRLEESTWQELQDDLSSSLSRLLAISDDAFWRSGWVYTRVQHRIAFIYNGQIVLDAALPLTSRNHSWIGSVTPIAVSVSEKVQFIVKGYNLSRPTARLLCALEGKYLPQEATSDLLDSEHKEIQCLAFPCSVPDIAGRGFLEVEDHGLSGDFFPFIVAEQDVCLEIRTLESAVEASEFSDDSLVSSDKMGMKNQVLNFIHEMGWLLRRCSLRSRLSHTDLNSEIFPLTRFRWLMEFSMDHDWCAVVKKLLDVLFDGNVGSGEYSSVELAVLDMGLLHRAVRRRCRQMVELLLRYVPKQPIKKGSDRVLFRPDVVGPAGLTPLHIVASSDGSENLLDALTDDPGLVGVKAWKTLRDDAGSTPEDYAYLRGHYSYINLVQKKIEKIADTGHVVLDIPNVPTDINSNQKQNGNLKPTKLSSFQIGKTNVRPIKMQRPCIACDQQLSCRNSSLSLVYRPTMLSILAIAAIDRKGQAKAPRLGNALDRGPYCEEGQERNVINTTRGVCVRTLQQQNNRDAVFEIEMLSFMFTVKRMTTSGKRKQQR
ncbi:Squamosa promoter binding-like protein, partial [Thalictrum thalictroides]